MQVRQICKGSSSASDIQLQGQIKEHRVGELPLKSLSQLLNIIPNLPQSRLGKTMNGSILLHSLICKPCIPAHENAAIQITFLVI